jgi:hypothetical protein
MKLTTYQLYFWNQFYQTFFLRFPIFAVKLESFQHMEENFCSLQWPSLAAKKQKNYALAKKMIGLSSGHFILIQIIQELQRVELLRSTFLMST